MLLCLLVRFHSLCSFFFVANSRHLSLSPLDMLGAGQLVSDWYSGAAIVPHVQLGDLLEFRRVAVIRGVPRTIYTHWAVYIGRHEGAAFVVHLSGDDGDFEKFDGNGNGSGSFSFSGSSPSGVTKPVWHRYDATNW
ncbi:hypothetical protein KIN20_007784 [Parelaphostrongylus tenuis]|uniref:LRAT domain-containing protein n=1 Tax=Parelaphostrongylus tenuis TaxID=148309 RepID=A0AAD5QI31_PARTN|nr:hypothetical protein KIN20_007784 [Parelaphostrongylus tenuis]